MSTLATLVVKLVGDVSGFRSDMESAGETVRNVGRNIGDAGGDLTRNLTVPIVGAGTAAVLMGNQFNEGMANVVSLVPEASTEIAGMSDDVQQLAVDMGQSTSDMTAGLYQQISATGYGADSLELLRVNATAAAAGLSTTREAIDLTSAVTRGYGDTTVEATQKASDLALKTVQMGQTTFPELASSIGRVVPLAAQLGVSQEELFGVMATGAGVTGTASEVATQFRGVLQSMMAPTEAMQGAFEELHVANAQQLLDTYGLEDGLTNIMTIAAASGQPLQSYIGSIEGQTLALSLVGPQAEDWVTKTEAMRNAAGTAQAAFEAQTQGVNEAGFAMQQAAIQVQVMGQQVGQALMPVVMAIIPYVQQFLQWIQGLVAQFTALDPKTQAIILGAIGLAAAIGPILMVLGPIVTGFGALVSVLGLIVSPIGLVIAAVVALGVAVVNHFGGVQQTIQAVVSFVQGILTGLSDFIHGNGAEMGGWIQEAWGRIQSIVQGVVYYVQQIVSSIFGAVATFISAHGAEIQAFMQQAWSRIGEIVNLALQVIQATVIPILRGIAQFISEHGAEIQRVLEFAWNAIRTVIDTVLTVIEGILRAALAVLRGDWEGAWDAIKATVETVWGTIRTIVETVLNAISRIVDEKLNEIRNWFTERWEAIKDYLRSIDLADLGRQIIQGLIDGVRSMAQSLIDAAVGVVQSAIDAAKSLLGISSPSRVFKEIGEQSMAGLGLGFRSGSGNAADALEEAIQMLIEMADEIPEGLGDVFAGFGNIADALQIMVNGPAGNIEPIMAAWQRQIILMIRMLKMVWNNWEDKAIFDQARKVGDTIADIAKPWEKLAGAMAIILAGPGGDITNMAAIWQQQIKQLIRIFKMVWNSFEDKSVFDQAKQISELAGAISQPWEDLQKAFEVIRNGPGQSIEGWLRQLWEPQIVALIASLARMADSLHQSTAAANVAGMIAQIVGDVGEAISSLTELGGVSLEDIAAVVGAAGETWVNGLMAGIRLRLPMLWELIINVRGMLGQIDTLTPGIVMGRNWIDGIIVGIQQGLPLLNQAAAAAVAGISKPGAGGGPDGGPEMASAGGNQVTVNMYGPWNVRDQGDIEAIAQRVAEVLGQRSAAVKRVTV